MYSKNDIAFLQPHPFAVYVRNDSVSLNKYVQVVINEKQINYSYPVGEYRSVAELLLDFLRGGKWFHSASAKQTEFVKELIQCIYIEPEFPSRTPSARYRIEIAKRKAHLYDVKRIKPPLSSYIAEKIAEKISKLKTEGKPLPELPDYRTSEGLEACLKILKISPPKAEGFLLSSDDLILWALEESTRQDLVIAPCKECGQLFVKDTKDCFCSRHCSDLSKVDCGRFCGDKEIKALYNSIYKALNKEPGRSPKSYIYSPNPLQNSDELFSDLSALYENFTHSEHKFSESDFEVMKQTFLDKMFAPKYENFKCVYRHYKIEEIPETDYLVTRSEFLNWLREVKSQVDNFVKV